MFPKILRREILLLLAGKALILTILYLLFFSSAHQSSPDTALLQAHLLRSSPR